MKIKAPSHGTVVAYLALFMAMTGTAAAATGGTFLLGRGNSATTQTSLSNSGGGAVLSLSGRPGQVPLAVGAGAGKATNLNADKLDGLDSSQLVRQGVAVDATTLGGTPATGFAQAGQLAGLQRRVSASCGDKQAISAVASDGTVTCVSVAPAPVTTAPPSARDKGFAISDLQVSKDGSGAWTAVARMTNETANTRSGNFTVTVFRNSRIVTTLRGTVSSLSAGGTNTLGFYSSDQYSDGDYGTAFQTDVAVDS